MPVTADSTLWTADTICVTADGRVICIDADVAEPVGGHGPTADSTLWTADSTILTADGGAVAGATDTLDAIVQVAGAVISADVVEPAAALDTLDAAFLVEVIPAPGGGARYPRRRPLPVYGVGYGLLPQLWGEAHGVVGVAGKSAAQVFVKAAAVGASGQAGNAAAVLKALSVAGNGAVGTRGAGEGMIVKFNGTATGRHDDDEAAVIAFLLAA
jgi:hypothetical protein